MGVNNPDYNFQDNSRESPHSFKDSNENQKDTFPKYQEKNYNKSERFKLFAASFAKTYYSLGFALISSKVRDDWKAVFTGKKISIIKTPSSPESEATVSEETKKSNRAGRATIIADSKAKKAGDQKSFFKKAHLFFARLGLAFKHGEWYSSKKVKQITSELLHPSNESSIENRMKELTKIISVLNSLSKAKTLSPEQEQIRTLFTNDPSPGFSLLTKISKVDQKLLFHIHSDEYGANNDELEGYTAEKTLNYMNEFLQARKAKGLDLYGLPDSVLDEISWGLNLSKIKDKDSFIKLIQEKVHKNPASKFLIPGGWAGSPSGHAMYYEVIPQENGKITFRLFNLGAGSTGAIDPSDYKTKAPAYIDFEGISLEHFTSDNTLAAIYEMKSHAMYPETHSKTNYDAEDVYQGLKKLLMPTQVTIPKDQLKTTQRAGICAWRSLMAFMSSQTSKEEYKRFACDIRMQSLIHRNWENLDPEQLLLLEKAHAKLARKVDKLAKNNTLGNRYLLQADHYLSKIAVNLKNHKITSPYSKFSSSTTAFESDTIKNLEVFTTNLQPLFTEAKKIHLQSQKEIDSQLINSIHTYTLPEAIKACREAIDNKAFLTANIALKNYIMQLSLPSNYEAADLVNLSAELKELSKLYFNTCFLLPECEIVLPERIIVLEKMFFLQTQVAKDINPNITNKIFYKPDHSIFFSSTDNPGAFENDLATKNVYNKKGLTPVFYLNNELNVHFYNSENLNVLFQNPAEFFKHNPNYHRLPHHEQMAELYMSTATPQWFQGLRDTSIYLKYLETCSVENPLDGTTSFDIHFEKIVDEDSTKLSFSIEKMKNTKTYPILENNKERNGKQFYEILSSNYSFSTAYPPFHSEEMETLVKFIVNEVKDVKTLLCQNFGNLKYQLKFSDEHIREIAHIFTESNKITEGFEYFYRHPEKLKDSDYQTLFQIVFFNDNSLNKELKKGNFSLKLNNFLKEQLDQSLKTNEIQKAVFLIRMTRIFNDCHKNIESQSGLLSELSHLPALSKEEKSFIYAELVASLGKKTNLTSQEIEDLAVGYAFLQDYPVLKNWALPQQEHEIKEAFYIHNDKIKKAFFEGASNSILDRVAKEIYQESQAQSWHTKDGVFQSGDALIFYDPSQGKMLSKKHELLLPLELLQHPHFKRNFEGIERGKFLSNNIFSFKDQGKETLIKLVDDQLIIEQKMQGTWYRFLPEEAFISTEPYKEDSVTTCLGSRYLTHNYLHWQDVSNPKKLILIDPKTAQPSYEATFEDKKITKIVEIGTQKALMAPSKLLSRVEDLSYIQEWGDGTQADHIELPRLDLSFKRDHSAPELWHSEQFQGYFLAKEQYLPTLGVYKNYLILENSQGKKKVVIPQYKLKSPHKKNAAFAQYSLDRLLKLKDREVIKYHSFDISKQGILENQALDSKYFLALILTTAQEYTTAAHYLTKFGSKLTPYSNNERDFLISTAKMEQITGDTSGNGLALQTYASYLLVRNSLDHNIDLDFDESKPKEILNIYKNYLAHLGNATALQLAPHEELFLIKYFLNKEFDPVLFLRLENLDPDYAKNVKIPEKKQQEDLSTINFELQELTFSYDVFFNDIPSFKNLLLTRINTYIAINPIAVFDMVVNANESEKKWFEDAFKFGKGLNSSYSFLFEDILKHPEMYPKPPQTPKISNYQTKNTYKNDVKEWWKNIGSIASQNLSDQKKEVEITKTSHKDKVTFNPKQNEIANPRFSDVNIQLNINSLPSFSQLCQSMIKETHNKPLSQGLNNWLNDELANPTSKEPLYTNEIQRLQQDIAYQRDLTHYTLTDIPAIEKLLNNDKDVNHQILKDLEIELLTLSNRGADNFADQLLENVQLNGQIRKAVTLNDLIISFAKKDPNMLFRLNPNIAPVINDLHNIIGNYLMLLTHEQQRARALNSLTNFKNAAAEEKHDFEQQLAVDLLAERSYNPSKNPAYLAFEYYANVMMRPQQAEKLQNFIDNKDDNQIMEMIMGSGKSKVLLPLLGLLRADGEKISMVVVPQPLFESVSSDTQKTLSEAFSQSLKTLHFHRSTEFDKATLERIKDDLVHIQKNKECLIITSKSLQSLLLKFVEQCSKEKGKITEEIALMRDILKLLSHSHPIIDEVDTILNVLHEVSFSAGKDIKPKDTEIQLIGQLYTILYTDEDINKLVRIESNNNAKSGVELTETNYHKNVKELLAKKYLNQFMPKGFSVLENLLALDYLCRKNTAQAQRFFDSLPDDKKNTLSLAAEQLNNFLPHTLTKPCDEKYGLDKKSNSNIAIPYAAANTPNYGSQFSTSYITMNYTFQYYMKEGLSEKILIQELEKLQAKAIAEMKEMGPGALLEQTEVWKIFKELSEGINVPLFNFNSTHIEKLANHVNSQTNKKIYFIESLILPQMMLSEKKLSCNPLDLMAFFDNASGFTGTLWNQHSMHSKLKTIQDPGIDSKTLNLLWQMCGETSGVTAIKAKSPKDIVQELKKSGVHFDLISDSGGYFKEGGNTVIATDLAKMLGKPVVFYNANNQQAITDGSKEMLLKESTVAVDQRYTFLDQSHTTGSDVPYKRDATGIVTISRNMLLRDLLQSVWRLRGLDKSQKVHFVISEEVRGIICEQLGKAPDADIFYPDILRFTILNQTKAQGNDNFRSLVQEMQGILKNLLFKAMLSENSTEDMQEKTFAEIEKLWIKEAQQEPKDLFGTLATKESSHKVLKQELEKFAATVAAIEKKLPFFSNDLAELQERIQEYAQSLEPLLPIEIMAPVRDTDDDQTVEIQQETQQETQVELEVNEIVEKETKDLGRLTNRKEAFVDSLDNRKFDFLPVLNLETYLETVPELKNYKEAFSGVAITFNVLQWKSQQDVDLKLFGGSRTPFHQIEFIDGKALIRTNYELKSYENKNVYNLGFGFYDPNQQLTAEQQKQIIKIKFLNGESNYTKQEAVILKAWIKKQGPQKMLYLMQNHILPGMPDKTVTFNSDSTLMRIFKSLNV